MAEGVIPPPLRGLKAFPPYHDRMVSALRVGGAGGKTITMPHPDMSGRQAGTGAGHILVSGHTG